MTVCEPRLMTGREAAAYCRVTATTWAKWVALRIVPAPIPGTRRWDRRALDLALDKLSGIEAPRHQDDRDAALEQWMREDAAKQAGTSINDPLRPRYRWEDEFDAAWADHLAEHPTWYAQPPAGEAEQLRQRLWNVWKELRGTALALNMRPARDR